MSAAAVPTPEEQHAALLDARRTAQEAFPPGHPERVAAEHAVRQSRIARRTNAQWAIRALNNAERRASQKSDPYEAVKTLHRGIATARSWLNGTNPKAKAS
jgi:hypothetical protein